MNYLGELFVRDARRKETRGEIPCRQSKVWWTIQKPPAKTPVKVNASKAAFSSCKRKEDNKITRKNED